MSTTEVFDPSSVRKTMDNIKSEFDTLSTTLDSINKDVTTALGSPDKAIYGDAGDKILATWDENCSTLKNFIGIYDNWSNMTVAIATEYGELDTGTAKVEDADIEAFKSLSDANKTKWLNTKNAKNLYKGELKDPVIDKSKIKSAIATLKPSIKTKTSEKAARDKERQGPAKYKNPANLSGNQLSFIESIIPGAVSSYKKYGVLPSLTLAQAILESGWGESGLSAKYNNFFGIKAGSSWTGKTVNLSTGEQTPSGASYTIRDNFRVYDNPAESIEDHAKLLTNDRYKNVIASKNYKDACYAVKAAGYATAVNYSSSLISLIEQYGLNQWDPK